MSAGANDSPVGAVTVAREAVLATSILYVDTVQTGCVDDITRALRQLTEAVHEFTDAMDAFAAWNRGQS